MISSMRACHHVAVPVPQGLAHKGLAANYLSSCVQASSTLAGHVHASAHADWSFSPWQRHVQRMLEEPQNYRGTLRYVVRSACGSKSNGTAMTTTMQTAKQNILLIFFIIARCINARTSYTTASWSVVQSGSISCPIQWSSKLAAVHKQSFKIEDVLSHQSTSPHQDPRPRWHTIYLIHEAHHVIL